MAPEYGWWYILPSIEVKHKYWYIWQILLSWGRWCLEIDIIREGKDENEDE